MKTLTAVGAGLVLLLTPSTGLAQPELPVGKADGVRVVREHGAIVVIFTARAERLYKRIAGKVVLVSCTELPDEEGPGLAGTSTGTVPVRAPTRRGKLRTGDLTRGMDYCRVRLPARTIKSKGGKTRVPARDVVSVPLTQKGAVFLDEEEKAADLLGTVVLAGFVAEKRKLDVYPTHAQLTETYPKAAKVIVALANPTDSPPAGKVGYYSDGQERVAVATMSASGRRLFIEYGPDDVFSSNITGHIFGDSD